jgi:hypothetical protein
MPWIPHEFVLPWDAVWYWGCIPDAEATAARMMALSSILGVALVPAVYVDAVFLLASPGWWETRLLAFRGGWNIGEGEIEVDDVPVRFYVCSAAWVSDVSACVVDAGCVPGSGDCTSRSPYGS